MGVSTDNVYYFDGMNVTDPVTGTFGANLNTEIIQEQKVITGGIPAEYVGATGLISNVVTKSGSNIFHGSANYFFQNGDLVAENQNGAAQEFSTKDNAYTFGGPLHARQGLVLRQLPLHQPRGRRRRARHQPVPAHASTTPSTRASPRAAGRSTGDDLVSFTYLSDPTEVTGRRDRDITNARDRAREQGGHRYLGQLHPRVGQHPARDHRPTSTTARSPTCRRSASRAIDVLFRGTDSRTLTDEQHGGFGRDLVDQRDNQAIRATLQRVFGSHAVKVGGGWENPKNFRDTDLRRTARASTTWTGQYPNITAADIAAGGWSNLQFDVTNTSDFGGFINTINGRADRARFYAAFDANGDGTITLGRTGRAAGRSTAATTATSSRRSGRRRPSRAA